MWVMMVGCLTALQILPLGTLEMMARTAQPARIKDIASIEGVRENQLIGYGLVVGLDRTGDSVVGGQFTAQAIISMLNTMGINLKVDPIQLLTKNTASVIVTAKLPPFARPGMKLDVQVSSLANAKSLKGGTLLLTQTPDEMRGRISSVNSIFIGVSNELGAFESGFAASLLGPIGAVVFGGIGTIIVVTRTGRPRCRWSRPASRGRSPAPRCRRRGRTRSRSWPGPAP